MKKIFKKVFKSFKKILKPIGKELKKGLKSAGKAFGKLGPVGTLALSLMLPGLGTFMGSLGTVVGNVAATAPFAGTIMAPVGQVISGIAKVAQAGGKVFNSISKYVGDTVNGLTGGSFKGEMVSKEVTDEVTGKVTTEMVKNQGYKKGMSTKFSDWVGAKIDKTRQSFGLETGMDERELGNIATKNKESLTGINDVNTKIPTAVAPTPSPESMFETSTSNKKLTDDELFAKAEKDSLLSSSTPVKVKEQTYLEQFPDRETVDVTVGYKKSTPEDLTQFSVEGKNTYDTYALEKKTYFKDQFTPEQLDGFQTQDTEYFANFQNNKVSKTQDYIKGKYTDSTGAFTEDYSKLTSENLDMQMVRQDVGAIAKPAAFVGSMLAPEETPQSTGSSGYVAPLSTDVADKQYQQGAERAYAEYGYKGPNTMGGFHMEGAFGNTPINYFQKGQRTQSTMTTALPTLG
jgi:hypothetical protein